MTLLIFYVVLALGVSFLCSIMEAVLLSVTPSYVAKVEAEDPGNGAKLAALKKDVDRPLAAILSLNTIAHTVGAAGAGAQATVVFGNAYVGAASAVLTFLILVVSEIIPKTLGAVFWRNLAIPVTKLLRPTMITMWPLVKMAEGITWLIARGKKTSIMGRDEFYALTEYGTKEGVLHASEGQLLGSVLRFGDLVVRDIMTPRTVMFVLSETDTVSDVVEAHPSMVFSRIPLIKNDKDDIDSFVLRTEILSAAANGQGHVQLKDLSTPICKVSDAIPLHDLFEKLIKERTHIAIVLGEYGGTAGLVTLEDIVESLLGLEIVDEHDTVEDMQSLARDQKRD